MYVFLVKVNQDRQCSDTVVVFSKRIEPTPKMTQSYSHTSKLQYGVITACQTGRGPIINMRGKHLQLRPFQLSPGSHQERSYVLLESLFFFKKKNR
jgi:hypothetical protein